MPWKEFIRSPQETLASVDFFTAEVWTAAGLMTTTVLVFMRIAPSQIHIAGITLAPTRGVDEAAGSQRDDGWRWLPEPLSKFTARPRDQI